MAESDTEPSSLLARFAGHRPPAPEWFTNALEWQPERSTFEVEGVDIELLTWGEIGKPGLLFLHGNGAHADWWSFIAPTFARRYRCAAISWSGMGRSGWRPVYTAPQYAREALRAIEVAGLDRSGAPPAVIAHSFGTTPLLHFAGDHPEKIACALLIDALPLRISRLPPQTGKTSRVPIYASEAEALARFRFVPAQGSEVPAVVDYIARNALKRLEVEGAGAQWTWCFDPDLRARYDRSSRDPDLMSRVDVPIALIYGEHSIIATPDRVAEAMSELKDCLFAMAIPKAAHHIMADQPLALMSAIGFGLDYAGHRGRPAAG